MNNKKKQRPKEVQIIHALNHIVEFMSQGKTRHNAISLGMWWYHEVLKRGDLCKILQLFTAKYGPIEVGKKYPKVKNLNELLDGLVIS